MQLSDVFNNCADQDKGADLNLLAPWDGKPTGMIMTIAGPDSDTARRADLAFSDELVDLADNEGHVTAESRHKARINALARRVLRWDVMEDDKPVPFNQASLVKLLQVQWIMEQVDGFAGDRTKFAPGVK